MQSNTKTTRKETRDEMIGMLTAISIVSKRLATRLSDMGESCGGKENGGEVNEQNQATAGCRC